MMRKRPPLGGDFQASLGAISSRLGDLVDALRHTAEEIAERQQQDREDGQAVKTQFDIRVRGLGLDQQGGDSQVRPRRAAPAQPAAPRTLLLDVFEEQDAVLVAVEVSGVPELQIILNLDLDGRLHIQAGDASGEAMLGPGFSLHRVERSLLNGVLSLRFWRGEEGA